MKRAKPLRILGIALAVILSAYVLFQIWINAPFCLGICMEKRSARQVDKAVSVDSYPDAEVLQLEQTQAKETVALLERPKSNPEFLNAEQLLVRWPPTGDPDGPRALTTSTLEDEYSLYRFQLLLAHDGSTTILAYSRATDSSDVGLYSSDGTVITHSVRASNPGKIPYGYLSLQGSQRHPNRMLYDFTVSKADNSTDQFLLNAETGLIEGNIKPLL